MPRKVFVAGEILTASDVNTNLMDQSVMVFDDATARDTAIPTPVEGMVTYLKDTNLVQAFTGSAFTAVGGILQVVRATNSTNQTTTSTTFVDSTLSVTITPAATSSKIILISTSVVNISGSGGSSTYGSLRLVNGSNVVISGANNFVAGQEATVANFLQTFTLVGFDSPNTTSSVTYKLQFSTAGAGGRTVVLSNASNAGQIIAMEVAG